MALTYRSTRTQSEAEQLEMVGILNNLKATPGHKKVVLAWVPSANDAQYQIKRSNTGSVPMLLATIPAGTTEYADSGVKNSESYDYLVTTIDTTGQSGDSNTVTAIPTWALRTIDWDAGAIGGMVVLIVIIAILWGITKGDSDILKRLQDQAHARGVIAFMVIFGTIAIAFRLALRLQRYSLTLPKQFHSMQKERLMSVLRSFSNGTAHTTVV